MSDSPTRRIVGTPASSEAAASEEGAVRSQRHAGIKPRHRGLSPPPRSQLLRRLLAAALACAIVFAIFKARSSSSPPPPPPSKVYVSPLPESAVAAAAKAASDITAATAAAFGLPGTASSAHLRGRGSASSSSSRLPLPSVGLPRPPRADRHPSDRGGDDEHAGETQQAFFDRVLLDRVEAVDVGGGTSSSASSASASSSSSSPPDAPPPAAPLAARAVRAAAAHAWAGYVAHAWGEDELAPQSREGYETFCSLAVTAVDSLDTLLLLGMEREFGRARAWLLRELPRRLRAPCAVSVFEATIRVVGGLAAAADLSGDGGGGGGGCGGEARGRESGDAAGSAAGNSTSSSSSSPPCSSLGDLAALAAEALLPAFHVAASAAPGSPPRLLLLPVSEVDLGTGAPLAADAAAFGDDAAASGTALLAEAGSLAPEFWRAGYWRAASELGGGELGKEEEGKKRRGGAGGGTSGGSALAAEGASAVDAILSANPPSELPLPATTLLLSDATAAWSERHTVGGRADSYYEYLLKMWLMLRRAAEAEAEAEEGAAAEGAASAAEGVAAEGAAAAAAAEGAAGGRNSSSSSSLASGFVRDREAELEALSYISQPSSSSHVPPEEEEEEKHRHGRDHRHHHDNRERTPPPPRTPLARRAELYRRAWLIAVDEILEKLVRETPGGSRYPTSDMGEPVMEHLSCFFPGNLALGVMSGAVSGGGESGGGDGDGAPLDPDPVSEKEKTYLAAADALAETCARAGETTATGLAPEVVLFLPEARPGHPFSVLRPEAVESFFYLWRATKDPKWRQHGWNTFVALERHAKVAGGGYSGVRDVTVVPPTLDDSQPSWLLAETFKYLFLLFSEDSALDLDEFVLNTEAHPLRVFGEKKKEKKNKKKKKKREEEVRAEEEEFRGQRRRHLPQQQESKKSSTSSSSSSHSSSSSSSSRRHLKP